MTDAPHAHLDDDAAAYALGALDASGMARVDALAASCDECARRVGEAEATVARLVVPADAPARAVPRVLDCVSGRGRRSSSRRSMTSPAARA